MRTNRPTHRASTEVQFLLAAGIAMMTLVAYAAVKQFIYGFYTDPAAGTAQASNVANGIGNIVSAVPGIVVAVLVVVVLVGRALE